MRVKTIAMGWVLVGLSGAGNVAAATTTINEPARDTTAKRLQGIPPAEQASSASAQPALAYRISRLMQMGIEDPALSGTFAVDAPSYASSLLPAVLEVLEKDVQSQFSSVFAGRGGDMESFALLCD